MRYTTVAAGMMTLQASLTTVDGLAVHAPIATSQQLSSSALRASGITMRERKRDRFLRMLGINKMEGKVVPTSPMGEPFQVGPDGPTWTGPTGTSFLPAETVERAKEGNPIEKAKLAKDGTEAWTVRG